MSSNAQGSCLLQVISTRPQGDTEQMAEDLAELPLELLAFPANIPKPREWSEALSRSFKPIPDLCFFPSRHAVSILQEMPLELRSRLRCACPGAGTAAALQQLGVKDVLVPQRDFTSEALLALAELQAVCGYKVLILTAPGGRDHFSNVLRERGANVDSLMVYDRVTLIPDCELVRKLATSKLPLLSIVTSAQGLAYLHQVLAKSEWEKVCAYSMIVPSERVAIKARQLGVHRLDVVAPPSNLMIVTYIQTNFDTLIMQ